MEYVADTKHRELLIEGEGLNEKSKSVVSPIVKTNEEEGDDVKLDKAGQRKFRGSAARASFLGLDRPDVQYATKEACRGMANPSVGDTAKVKRLARYLVGSPNVVWKYGLVPEEELMWIDALVDSDWAGCHSTRKSTSGGILCVAGAGVKSWSSTQGSVALSSGEAECYAALKGAAEALGLQALGRDLGWQFEVRLWTDSSSAKSVASRRGLGKIRHMEVKYLWLQEAVRRRRLIIKKVAGKENAADVLTKPLSKNEMQRLLKLVSAWLE